MGTFAVAVENQLNNFVSLNPALSSNISQSKIENRKSTIISTLQQRQLVVKAEAQKEKSDTKGDDPESGEMIGSDQQTSINRQQGPAVPARDNRPNLSFQQYNPYQQ